MKEFPVSKPDPVDVEAAEAAHQRTVCFVPDGDLPDDLALALLRRVEVNLEQATDATVRRVGHLDEQVRGLEAPYRRRRTPEPTPEPRRRKKPAKKTAAITVATTTPEEE